MIWWDEEVTGAVRVRKQAHARYIYIYIVNGKETGTRNIYIE